MSVQESLVWGIRYDAEVQSYVATDELTRLMEKAGFTFLGTPQRLFRNYDTHLTYSFDTWGATLTDLVRGSSSSRMSTTTRTKYPTQPL